ncbi:F-type H+-transporting ATPase subunit delta [Halpernia humi]|uniref:ATP synthase subunit delta n=1 Tax=Halpernia humi TaxID=493375 RepID=A0A1H6BM57_9FLAO|nr:ATP synthase F1 subunit delta [Halpernia humi]SEG61773.1 F-type H+-transporting ATPase subunit delta [Halpernia humi]
MRTSKVAKRYAQGLLEFSTDSGSTTALFGEMKDVVNILKSSRELNSFLQTPVIDSKKKIAILGEIFKNFSVSAQNFISLIIKQGREKQLQQIAQAFIDKVETLEGLQKVSLTSATQLSAANVDAILKSTNLVDAKQKFDLQTNINPNILGGYILRVGDQQVDASVRSKLSQLNKEFQLN